VRDRAKLPRGLNGLFWQERAFGDGRGSYHYSPALAELRLEAPPLMWGGLLCEEMGLGKTLEVASLVVASLPSLPREAAAGKAASRATLIIVPPALLSQWLVELAKATDSLSVLKLDEERALTAKAAELARHDVVLTTYQQLLQSKPLLAAVAWARVVLDEMQEVAQATSELAVSCEALHAPRRWMVSGTPLSSSIDDLKGELAFLRITPFGANHEDGFWEHNIGRPYKQQEESALDALRVLLRALMMRHSKSGQRVLGSGAALLDLPPRSDEVVAVPLESSQLAVYAYLEALVTQHLRQSRALRTMGDAHSRQERTRSQNLVSKGLRLLNEACLSTSLIAGGDGCSSQLPDINDIERELQLSESDQQGATLRSGNALAPLDLDGFDDQMKRMTPDRAIRFLDSLGGGDGGGRMNTAEELSTTRNDFELKLQRRASYTSDVARLRWHLALERITAGARIVDDRPWPLQGVRLLWLLRGVQRYYAKERLKVAAIAAVADAEGRGERRLKAAARWQRLARPRTGGGRCRRNRRQVLSIDHSWCDRV